MLFVRYKKIERKKKGHRQRKEKKKKDFPGSWICNGILCSWMCRCQGNSNLVTSLFQPNPALKLWLLHPFAWLP